MIFEKLEFVNHNRFLVAKPKTPAATPLRNLSKRRARLAGQSYKKKDYSFIELGKRSISPQRKQIHNVWIPQSSLEALKPLELNSYRARYVRAYTPGEEVFEYQLANFPKQQVNRVMNTPKLPRRAEKIMKVMSKDNIAGW